MSSERPSKNNPMRKIAGSLQGKLSSLFHLSRVPTPSLIEIDPSSDNNIATSNAGTSNLPLNMVSALGDEHTPTTAVVTTELESFTVAPPDSVSVSTLIPAVRRQLGSPGPETVLTRRSLNTHSLAVSSSPDAIMQASRASEQDLLAQNSGPSFFENSQDILITGGNFGTHININIPPDTGDGQMKFPLLQKPNSSPIFTGQKDVLEKLEKISAQIALIVPTPSTSLPTNSNPNSLPPPISQTPVPTLSQVPQPPLIVSDTILGYGSHGTVVYQGSFQGRAVAVKRLLQDFVTLATREVSILQQSDDHPNVIRYYYQETHLNFSHIALELCPASLADIIENPHGHGVGNGSLDGSRREEEWKNIVRGFDAKRAMRQVASGLRHLHGLGLIHRDIKPQNILISSSPSSGGRGGTGYRMLISDFGLCKKLDVDQTSFLPTFNGATGTVGWRAPEILRGDVKWDEILTGGDSTSSRGSVATVNSSSTTRLTKGVDIFALGCLFYYTLTTGGHPYGDRFEREVNILKDNKQLSLLSEFCSAEESTEVQDLICSMLHAQPSQRPDTETCLLHPFFWDPAKRLGFLQDASDRFEVMCRDPKDARLIRLEKDAGSVVGNDWHQRLDSIFIENLGKYRKYDGKSVQDLMRALRNKKHHYQDLPENVKRHLGPMPEGFLGYFTHRYPRLFMHVHGVVKDTGLHSELMFRTYFELPEP